MMHQNIRFSGERTTFMYSRYVAGWTCTALFFPELSLFIAWHQHTLARKILKKAKNP
ncbi:hypothetical protein BDV98DRAFT_568797 [Pterulicium gracile]|uniref:Uncharacterized protein n=1 Tax=Pterulicium gracile TaxID=1884261 RepID=A0A5C3QKX0_9AGAR|nr:hypothetical protein BDV98DRAFT_568797 [Pterula gracilis]